MAKFQAQLLVATPELPDDNFFRSVVLVVHHDDEGAYGVVLNRPTNFSLKEVWYAITESHCDIESPIFHGGPVEGPLVALHRNAALSENEVLDGIYISSQKENLESLLEGDVGDCKIFSGYSGWGDGQLENELETGSWFQTPATEADIFGDTENLWEEVAGRIGNQILFQGNNGKIAKFDPLLN